MISLVLDCTRSCKVSVVVFKDFITSSFSCKCCFKLALDCFNNSFSCWSSSVCCDSIWSFWYSLRKSSISYSLDDFIFFQSLDLFAWCRFFFNSIFSYNIACFIDQLIDSFIYFIIINSLYCISCIENVNYFNFLRVTF